MEPALKPAVENNKENKRVLVTAASLTLKEKLENLIVKLDSGHVADLLPLPELVQFAEKEIILLEN